MKADDIRSLNEKMQEKMLNTKSVAEHEAGFNSLALSLFTEMAAQLAEANENLKRVLNPPLMYDTSNIDPADWPDLPQPVQFTVTVPRATLRDQFAMAAMQGMLANTENMAFDSVAPLAYQYADAMMEARK